MQGKSVRARGNPDVAENPVNKPAAQNRISLRTPLMRTQIHVDARRAPAGSSILLRATRNGALEMQRVLCRESSYR